MSVFDLEQAINSWRSKLISSGLEKGTCQELENHLRDGIEELIATGLDEQKAFEQMAERIGRPVNISREHTRARMKRSWMANAMIIQSLLIQWRLLRRRSVFALINIMGLALGFACCLLIALFVNHELSYDQFHSKADRIYRVATDAKLGETDRSWALVPSLMLPALHQNLPEVESFTMLAPVNQSERTIKYKEQLFDESANAFGGVYRVDTAFFKVFDYQFIVGDPDNALVPNSVVITESKALKIFGRTDVKGEMIEILNIGQLGVSAVIKDPPQNAHFQFGYLVHSDFKASGFVPFIWVRAYVLLNKPGDDRLIQDRLKPLLDGALDDSQNAVEMFPFLQRLQDVHLTSHLEYEIGKNGNRRNIMIFALVALVILLIAGINFTNLATAKSMIRAREVGVRKVLGARKKQLMFQFLSESLVMSLIAMVIGLGLVVLTLPVFNQLTEKSFDWSVIVDIQFLVPAVLLSVLVGICAGLYPAFFMSAFRPMVVLKGVLGNGKGMMRKALVVLQFTISVILIFSTLVVLRQTHFMKGQGLGFQADKIIVLPVDRAWDSRKSSLVKQQMLNINGVMSASLSSHIPGSRGGVMVMRPEGFSEKETQMMDGIFADFDFIKTYDLDLLFGRDFSESLVTDSVNFIINEAAIRKFGWPLSDESVGRSMQFPNPPSSGVGILKGNIIGISRDAHFRSLHHAISPTMFSITNSRFPFLGTNYLSLRIESNKTENVLNALEENWQQLNLDKAFSYFFLDKLFDRQYSSEDKLSRLFIYFSFLAIFIACLGLFALAAFTTERKTKEIGIRKTLGATVFQLSGKITWGFTQWVLLANLLAWPVAALLMNQWLQGFAYRARLSPEIFILATVISLLISLLTVLYMTIRAARANPVKALRCD